MLTCHRYNFKCLAEQDFVPISFFGNTLRGGFGYAFKSIVCHSRNSECADCHYKKNCPYARVFETINNGDCEIMRKADHLPHPFVISPYPLPEILNPGEEFKFEIILFGEYYHYIPYFIVSFIRLGRRGLVRDGNMFKVKSVASLEPDREHEIYSDGSSHLKDLGQQWKWNDFRENGVVQLKRDGSNGEHSERRTEKKDELTIEFLSPARFKSDGKPVTSESISFSFFFRTLIRRLYNISFIYCNYRDENGFKQLIEEAATIKVKKSDLKWVDRMRYSTRQKKRIDIGGLTGQITFKGDLGKYMGFLEAGELFHVGNNTSFGLGKYRIV